MENNPGKSKTHKDWEIEKNVLSLSENAEDRNKAEWIGVLSRSTDKPRLEYCEAQNEAILYILAVQGHSHGRNQSKPVFSLKQIPLGWMEHTFHTGSAFNYKSILENGLWSGSSSLRSTRQACLLCFLDEHRMTLYKHSNRPDHECIF